MYTFGIIDYDRVKPTAKTRNPAWCKYLLKRLDLTPQTKGLISLGDTERLVAYLLLELAVEYDNHIPWDKDILEARLQVSGDIDWQSLLDSEQVFFREGTPEDLTASPNQNGVDPQSKARMEQIFKNFNTCAKRCQVPPVQSYHPESQRFNNLKARANNKFWFAEYRKALYIIWNSSFLNGGNETSWVMTLDWFLKEDSLEKILAGNFGGTEENPRELTVEVVRDGRPQFMPPEWVKQSETIIKRAKRKGDK